MSLLDEKRNDLERFIQAQMIGPGGCRNKFGKIGLENEEVLNTTPGSIYNTAILFPKKEKEDESVEQNEEQQDDIVPNDNSENNFDEGTSNEDDSKSADNGYKDDDEGFSLERRFPNSIGISCCLSENTDLQKDVRVVVSGRYYRKIEGNAKQTVFINVPEYEIGFLQELLNIKEINNFFHLQEGKLRIPFNSTKAEDVYQAIKSIDKTKALEIKKEVEKTVWGSAFKFGNEDYLFLHTCRRVLAEQLKRIANQACQSEIKSIISKVGQLEQILHYLEDLTHLYYKSGYGFWESVTFSKPVEINVKNNNEGRQSSKQHIELFSSQGNEHQYQIAADVLFQLTKDYRNPNNHKKYLKVMLQNDSTPFKESQKNQYTIVNEELNKLCLFGVKIQIESEKLEPYRLGESYEDITDEDDCLKFLYRNVKDYGVGHLCSVDWDKNVQPTKVWSEFLPSKEISDVDFEPRNKRADNWHSEEAPSFLGENQCLNLHFLSTFSDATDDGIRKSLRDFIGKYKQWIDSLPMDENGAETQYTNFAQHTKSECERDYNRISDNINRILNDESHMHSFRLMNSAMLMQMWHNKDNYPTISQAEITPVFYIDKGLDLRWRPFQLAFILLNLDGIIKRDNDSTWAQRNESVDLVWFPTGGGKTEAYLGIIAMTIIHRRRTFGESGGGTTAIMRYTLRLLATQQFQRALKLILALDQIRIWGVNNEVYSLGTEPITIGLYVGKSSLPNTYVELEKQANSWNKTPQQTNIPLDNKCPWCGESLVWGNIAKYKNHKYAFNCTNENCSFRANRLPVQLCDELVYEEPPTLLFGTVDKFAQLARKVSTTEKKVTQDSRRLFGTGVGIDYLTPDLIIQDELHLLLGPLGSAVALFEAAIDQLCTRKEGNLSVRPKIISSTATTRNTKLQIRALYDRDVNIFPKNGVDYDDSFFAFYKRTKNENGNVEWISKRKYLGILPTGRTQMLMQLRLAAILFVHRALFEKENWQEGVNDRDYSFVVDNYYSIISYFNSLKEVGKTDAQYPYEFTKYLQRLYRRVIGYAGLLDCYYADEDTLKKEELTGRLSGQEVVDSLRNVQKNFSVNTRLPYVNADGQVAAGFTPPDYILATNMISVGIDVDRFNAIIMNSMPRNISEYIQASSRVARKYKGLVITSHNPFRIRDVSHFEKFIEFHEKMYYYVDPISITPFSPQSINKYLPLYLGTIIRHTYANLQNLNEANNITQQNINDMVDNLMRYFNGRARVITDANPELQAQLSALFTSEMKDYISNYITNALNDWVNSSVGGIWYYDNRATQKRPAAFLYTETEDYDDNRADSYWVVPNSLRIVEQEAVLKIKNDY